MTNILIVEDDPIISEDLVGALTQFHFTVIGQAYDPESAVELLKAETLPDLVLLDIDLNQEKDGIDVAKYIRSNFNLPFIFLTALSDRATLQRARETHPNAYIVKPFEANELFAQIEIALYNHNHRLPSFPSINRVNQQLPTPLTDREYDLLKMLYKGLPNRSIANELELSTNTIKTHLRNLFVKLDVGSRIACITRLREMM